MASTESREALTECIEACEEALHACQECAAADIRDASEQRAGCALINLDCADMCSATLKALARGSEHHGDFCALCAHLCRVCAAECGQHSHDHCARCKVACERCAQACSKHANEKHAF